MGLQGSGERIYRRIIRIGWSGEGKGPVAFICRGLPLQFDLDFIVGSSRSHIAIGQISGCPVKGSLGKGNVISDDSFILGTIPEGNDQGPAGNPIALPGNGAG